MRWQLKAAVQKSLDFLPEASAENVNYALQRRVSRSFPTSEPQFLLHFDQAIEHVRNYERFAPPEAPALDQVRAYEFGAGWDLVGPLTMYSQGVNHQVLIDLRRLLRWELVDHVVKLFGSQREQLERRAGRELRPVNGRPIGSVEELRRRYGIEYHAPRDARDTGLPNASFNLITNTYTLE